MLMMGVVVEVIESNACPKCAKVKEVAEEVCKETGAQLRILDPIRDSDRIVDLGILTSPAVVINGKVKFIGIVPSREDLKKAIEEVRAC